jgi:hypothetical protein
MAISQSTIEQYVGRVTVRKSLQEAKREGKPTAFLSHSHKDAQLASGVQGFLQAQGWDVYIDWQDTAMPSTPNRETAERIQGKIRDLALFLFLATSNSTSSRWCPWEIGYADGVKATDTILIIPTTDSYGTTHGNEYLQLYRHIDYIKGGGLGHFNETNRGYALSGAAFP